MNKDENGKITSIEQIENSLGVSDSVMISTKHSEQPTGRTRDGFVVIPEVYNIGEVLQPEIGNERLGEELKIYTQKLDIAGAKNSEGELNRFGKDCQEHILCESDPMTMDSVSEHANFEKEDIPTNNHIQVMINQADKIILANWDGKELQERNPNDWCYPERFYVDEKALKRAWLTKFKQVIPEEVSVSLSINGGFSTGGRGSIFNPGIARPKPVSKHASGQKRKKRRK